MNTKYIGKCVISGRVEQLLVAVPGRGSPYIRAVKEGSTKYPGCGKDVLDEMERHFPRVSPFPLPPEQRRAWRSSYVMLLDAFLQLPEHYGKLQLVFEYVMPQHNPAVQTGKPDIGVRADVLLLSKDTVCILEFKDRPVLYPGAEKQARKYHRRLQRWHVESTGMNKKAVLVFTQMQRFHQSAYRVEICSADRLAKVIQQIFPPDFKRMTTEELKKWMASDWKTKDRYLKEK